MGTEKELEPGHHGEDNAHVVQATDELGGTVSRDASKSAEGHSVEISALEPVPKG